MEQNKESTKGSQSYILKYYKGNDAIGLGHDFRVYSFYGKKALLQLFKPSRL